MFRAELNYKKIILVIFVLLGGLVLLGGIIWLLFGGKPNNTLRKTAQKVTVTPGGSLPSVSSINRSHNLIQRNGHLTPEQQLKQIEYDRQHSVQPADVANGSLTRVASLFDDPVQSIKITGKGFVFLDKRDHRFYYLTAGGKKILLDSESFKFVDKVTWSNNGDKVILQYPDGRNIFYDLVKRKKKLLPKNAEDFSFDWHDNKLAYKFISPNIDDNWLVVNNFQDNSLKPIEPLGKNADKVEVSWSPTEQVVALYREATGLDSEEVFFLGLNNENFKSLKVNGSNFKGIWSPDGQKILYHVVPPDNSYNPVLWIVDATGDKIGNHNFNLGLKTWVDKCAFTSDSQIVYCAVPINLPQGAGLYPELVDQSEDVFYKIDLKTGLNTLVAYPVLSAKLDKFQVKKIFISSDNSKLYFWDKWTNQIYYMFLKK